jgi:cyclohexanone monooxygenase
MQQRNAGGVSGFRPVKSVNRPPAEPNSAPPAPPEILKLTPDQRRQVVTERGLGALLTFRDAFTDLQANEAANETFRVGVRAIVDDPATAERLCPTTYGIGCKRQVLDRDYYQTFNRSNVTLVDVIETPIEAITETGIRIRTNTDASACAGSPSTDHNFDVLIYATGFDAMTGALLRANITGRNSLKLSDKWNHGPVTYLGLQMSGFPNLFTITGPGSPSVLCNMLVAIEQHVNWIGDCIGYLRDNNFNAIEPLPEAEDEWVAHVNEVAKGTMYTTESCNSWYLGANIPGKPRIFMPYVGGYSRYRERCEEIVANDYEGFMFR